MISLLGNLQQSGHDPASLARLRGAQEFASTKRGVRASPASHTSAHEPSSRGDRATHGRERAEIPARVGASTRATATQVRAARVDRDLAGASVARVHGAATRAGHVDDTDPVAGVENAPVVRETAASGRGRASRATNTIRGQAVASQVEKETRTTRVLFASART